MNDAPDTFAAVPVSRQRSACADGALAASQRPTLSGRQRPERIPLSLGEQRLWLINRFDPYSPVHNVPISVELVGDVDGASLTAAVRDLIERHEVLRTIFPASADGPYQTIVPSSEITVDMTPVDLDFGDAEDPAGAILKFARQGFDLTNEVAFRTRLFRMAEGEYILTLVVHHIAADRASLRHLLRDLFQAYEARCEGTAPDWSALPLQYADYALWQRELLGEETDPDSVIAREIEFWRAELEGSPEVLRLPLDRPRPAFQSLCGKSVDFYLGPQVHASLQQIAASQAVPMFTVLQSAFAVLLSKLCATDDIIIGTPVDKRADDSLDPIVGMFGNTLALRSRVIESERFCDLLSRSQQRNLEAFSHAETPFERLVEVLGIPRSPSHHPVFQVMLSLHDEEQQMTSIAGLDVAIGGLEAKAADCDLELVLTETLGHNGEASGITASMVYAVELFDESTIVGIVQRFQRLLTGIATHPDLPVSDIDVLTDRERGLLLPHRKTSSLERVMSFAGHGSAIAPPQDNKYSEIVGRAGQLASRATGSTLGAGSDLALALLTYAAGKMDVTSAQRLAETVLPTLSRSKNRPPHNTRELSA
ncbi:condensation domain-containing protein [Hoyosella sp. YIM 151337]|uniref:condensation domain-containing protein n=1 Tax=Hoyosella sp. YIM 151337 TaxID=2992742 RepID=UPI0022369B1B|nr:condensation domain-containing protein [Hoyosella sp. YIM 151337]MCW4352264.1 condensation domain-containing protein [Hoyosella sp. YIM 151337]